MPAPNVITADKLLRLLGTPSAPLIVDLSSDHAVALPAAAKLTPPQADDWLPATSGQTPGQNIVVACDDGRTDSPAVAARLRASGFAAEHLDGGVAAWTAAGLPLIRDAKLPARNRRRQTLWVTRARPKVDRIACPWLIRRFVDPDALFLFVAPSDILATAERLNATPFDVEGAFWSHRADLCTFDVMLDEFGLRSLPALDRLSVIVRGADTARPDIAPQAAGLLAVSLGLSRIYADDHAQLDAGMLIYDALYRWCRDAVDETHDWVSHQSSARLRAQTPRG